MSENDTVSFLKALHIEIPKTRDCVTALTDAQGKKRRPPVHYITVADATALLGRSRKAIQGLLKRDAANPDGIHPWRDHGAAHAADFQRFLESKRLTGRGGRVRRALKERN